MANNPINRVTNMADYDLLTGKQQVRVIVYEYQDGKEEVFRMMNVEEEARERQVADREIHSRANVESSNPCVGFRFEYRDYDKVH